MSNLIFSAVKLPMLGKKGIIKPDDEGYYEICVGGLETSNNSGRWHYSGHEAVRKLFEESSIFMRRVRNGALRAEVNHPSQRPGEKIDSYMNRLMDIDLNNVCAHFKTVWLDFDYGKKNPHVKNPNLIAIMARVKPVEPKGSILLEQLQGTAQNCCFSIRALCDEVYEGGKRMRYLKDIIAIDLVNEGGITMASKWDTPSLESLDNEPSSIRLTKEILDQIMEGSRVVSTESSREVAALIQNRYFQKEITRPHYEQW